MNGRERSFIGAITAGWDLLELLGACAEFWPILPILAAVYLIRWIFTASSGGAL
jgi:hypothetical protein